MGSITLRKVSKAFGEANVIPSIDLEIEDGEFVVFVGPSGCGKSTLLRLIAGPEDVSGGTILIDGQDVRSEEHTSELQSLMRISYAVFCLTKKCQCHCYPSTTHVFCIPNFFHSHHQP